MIEMDTMGARAVRRIKSIETRRERRPYISAQVDHSAR